MFADVPDEPGFPEGIAVDGPVVYVSGPASLTFGLGHGPSVVWVYELATGGLQRTVELIGEDLLAPRGIAGMALDAQGRIYVTQVQAGWGIVRLAPPTYAQDLYATFDDLAPCALAPPPCSPTLADRGPFPNDLAFDAQGRLYVTDSMQATIWRVPPGGGAAEVWFQHPDLDASLGPNGVRVSPDGERLFFTLTFRDLNPLNEPGIYTLPLVEAPGVGDLQLFAPMGDGPDGLAFGAGGALHATAATANQVVVFDAAGAEVARFPEALANLRQEVPYDAPASLAFDGTGRLLVVNHALFTGTALPERFAVLQAAVGDAGAPLFRPAIPG